MTLQRLSDSRTAARFVCVFRQGERSTNTGRGIYIGKTRIYALPASLDQSLLVNPHIAVLGMTGSGKTYLLNAMIARAHIYLDVRITILDWNGEYSGGIGRLGGKEHSLIGPGDHAVDWAQYWRKSENRIDSFNLSELCGEEKGRLAKDILSGIMEGMRRYKADGKLKHLLFIDEAWRVLGSKDLAALFREGRKYGLAVIVATQMARDIANEVIANSACIFLFKLQNSEDFSVLEASELIDVEDAKGIARLKVGSCLLIERRKHAEGEACKVFIERVHGVGACKCVVVSGGNMRLEVKMEVFDAKTDVLCEDALTKAEVKGFVEANLYNVDLRLFVQKLMALRLDRARIVTYLRGLGVDDLSIVEAYDEAEAHNSTG